MSHTILFITRIFLKLLNNRQILLSPQELLDDLLPLISQLTAPVLIIYVRQVPIHLYLLRCHPLLRFHFVL